MAEKLYTIPVNEAFDAMSECPVCTMYQKLEDDAIDFMMGPSYMEDDIRMETNRLGFCKPHMKILAVQKNRLGIALILKTHVDRQMKDAEALLQKTVKAKKLLKKAEKPEISRWAEEASCNCYICNRIDQAFPRYLDTILQLYKKDSVFRDKYLNSKGFCQAHFGLLIEKGQEVLSPGEFEEFYRITGKLYTDNMKRLSEELDWFTDKFDYRYKDAPWKNSRDSIERAVIKTNGILPDRRDTL